MSVDAELGIRTRKGPKNLSETDLFFRFQVREGKLLFFKFNENIRIWIVTESRYKRNIVT
jgi:hypothetical protein